MNRGARVTACATPRAMPWFSDRRVNENDSYIFEVELPAQWVFSGEPTWISGWCRSSQLGTNVAIAS